MDRRAGYIIITDIDGTLCDSSALFTRILEELSKQYGIKSGEGDTFSRLVSRLGKSEKILWETYIRTAEQNGGPGSEIKVYGCAKSTLETLAEHYGIRIIYLTSRGSSGGMHDVTDKFIRSNFPAGYVVDRPPGIDPYAFKYEAVQRLKDQYGENIIAAFGDTEHDMEIYKSVGIVAIRIDSPEKWCQIKKALKEGNGNAKSMLSILERFSS